MPIVDVTAPPSGLIAAALTKRSPASRAPMIAIVTMTKKPTDFYTWLVYHREVCSVQRFYLRVEDTPELARLLSMPPWSECVEVEFDTGPRDYFVQMERQNRHIDSVLPRARAAGFEFLLHIDDDELLYCANGLPDFHAAIARAPAAAGNLHMHNLEAALSQVECVAPFHEVVAFRHTTNDFCAYSNGKSLGRLSVPTLASAGPHNFASFGPQGTHQLPPAAAVILHYEAASFASWRAKYADLARRHAGSSAVRERAPSLFYDESMRAVTALLAAETEGSPAAIEAAEAAARNLYQKWKVVGAALPRPLSGGCPLLLEEHGVTLIDVLGQPRIKQVHAMSHVQQPGPTSSLPPVPPTGRVDVARDSVECGAVRQLAALLRGAGVPELAAEAHAAALHAAGATATRLQQCSKGEVDDVTRRARLPLGPRLKLQGALRVMQDAGQA